MRPRHRSLPHVWLMTDPRGGDLIAAVRRLPRRSGIVFRHYQLAAAPRRRLFRAVLGVARRHGHVVLLADCPRVAWQWGADGAHHRSALASRGLRSVAVHSAREAAQARHVNADLIFVSPVYATRSHPGAIPLGPVRLGLIAGRLRSRTIALGGMTARRWSSLSALKLHGWAAIDAFGTAPAA